MHLSALHIVELCSNLVVTRFVLHTLTYCLCTLGCSVGCFHTKLRCSLHTLVVLLTFKLGNSRFIVTWGIANVSTSGDHTWYRGRLQGWNTLSQASRVWILLHTHSHSHVFNTFLFFSSKDYFFLYIYFSFIIIIFFTKHMAIKLFVVWFSHRIYITFEQCNFLAANVPLAPILPGCLWYMHSPSLSHYHCHCCCQYSSGSMWQA